MIPLTWIATDGREIPIASLDDDYLCNIYAQMIRSMEEKKLSRVGNLMLAAMATNDPATRAWIEREIRNDEEMSIHQYITLEWKTTNFRRYQKYLGVIAELNQRNINPFDDNNGWRKL
jgi:hypothetical protein